MNVQILEILEGITKYLDYTGQFKKLLTIIDDVKELKTEPEKYSTAICICIKADFPLLVDIAGDVAYLLLMEPYIAQQLFNKVLNIAVMSRETAEKQTRQIQSTLQVTLPIIPSLLPIPGKCIFPSSGLFVIVGILMAQTTPTKYCKSAIYCCTQENCSGRKGEQVFGHRATASLCSSCGCKREEFLCARVNGDQVLATFLHSDSFHYNFLRHQGVTVCFKEHLIKDLTLGVCYNIVVSYKHPLLQGWGIERTISENQWRFDHNLPAVGIPHAILLLEEQLQKTCPNSIWALTSTLASQLASHLYPVNSFFHLKTGLLLSLASEGMETIPVPILAVGPDCCLLLDAVSQLSQRRVAVTSPTLCGSIGGSFGTVWREAGPLLLASSGVCYIGDWAKFGCGRSSVVSEIITALESGQVYLVDSNNSVLGSPPNFPLRAAIWTFWSGDKVTSAARAQLQMLIKVFGMPFIGDGSADIEAVAKHLLSEAMQLDVESPSDLISTEDLKQYLKIARTFKVHITSEASRLLRSYFVASRRERPDCLPLTAIKTMTALAEAHARLCLRTQVIYQDAVLVIYLYEESIKELYGSSLMSPCPTVFGCLSIDPKKTSIAHEVDVILKNFSTWLEQYISSLLSENSVNCSISEE